MGILRSVRNRLARALEVREAVVGGALVDSDEAQWRRVVASGGDAPHELSDYQRSKERAKARHQYFNHAIGGGLADMTTARVLGEGAQYQAAEPAVQQVLDRFIGDPDNDLDANLPLFVTELQVFGELVLPIYLTPENADVRLGYLAPQQIEAVLWYPGDAKKPLAVVQKQGGGADDHRRLWVVPHPSAATENHFPPHPALTEEAEPGSVPGEDGLPVVLPSDAQGQVLSVLRELLERGDVRVAGYAFYHRANCLVSGRGRSLYERVNDWLKAFDDFFFGTIRQAILQQMHVWHVTLTNAGPELIEQRKKEIAREGLKPGRVLVTNEMEQWEALSPNLPAGAPIREILGGLLRLIGTAAGFPGHELGAEEGSNRSTAKEAATVSTTRAKRFQREVAAMVARWLEYQVDQKIHRGQLPPLSEEQRAVTVVLPELDAQDTAETAAAVKAGVEAMNAALTDNLVLPQDARRYVYGLLGQDCPDETAFDRAEQDRAAGFMDAAARQLLQRSGLGDLAPAMRNGMREMPTAPPERPER